MYTFIFIYENGQKFSFDSIERVSFHQAHGCVEIDGQQILSHNFRTNVDYYLHSENFTISVSCKDLRFIKVVKE